LLRLGAENLQTFGGAPGIPAFVGSGKEQLGEPLRSFFLTELLGLAEPSLRFHRVLGHLTSFRVKNPELQSRLRVPRPASRVNALISPAVSTPGFSWTSAAEATERVRKESVKKEKWLRNHSVMHLPRSRRAPVAAPLPDEQPAETERKNRIGARFRDGGEVVVQEDVVSVLEETEGSSRAAGGEGIPGGIDQPTVGEAKVHEAGGRARHIENQPTPGSRSGGIPERVGPIDGAFLPGEDRGQGKRGRTREFRFPPTTIVSKSASGFTPIHNRVPLQFPSDRRAGVVGEITGNGLNPGLFPGL